MFYLRAAKALFIVYTFPSNASFLEHVACSGVLRVVNLREIRISNKTIHVYSRNSRQRLLRAVCASQ